MENYLKILPAFFQILFHHVLKKFIKRFLRISSKKKCCFRYFSAIAWGFPFVFLNISWDISCSKFSQDFKNFRKFFQKHFFITFPKTLSEIMQQFHPELLLQFLLYSFPKYWYWYYPTISTGTPLDIPAKEFLWGVLKKFVSYYLFFRQFLFLSKMHSGMIKEAPWEFFSWFPAPTIYEGNFRPFL